MINAIYFDLDNTLVKDNPVTGKSEILERGLFIYNNLKKEYPNTPFYLYTARFNTEVSFPKQYSFSEIWGKDNMVEYIKKNFRFKYIFNLRKLYIFLQAYVLYLKSKNPKAYFLFLRHISKNEQILVVDDDTRFCEALLLPPVEF